MKLTELPFEKTNSFSKNDTAYINSDPRLKEFYLHEPILESFEEIIRIKSEKTVNRKILIKALEEQYSKMVSFPQVEKNIQLLEKENTFTITTAHQPSLFTGPLYFIYKIISTINLCHQLNQKYNHYNFIPIFWSGGEDHDFEEINHVKVFRDKLIWENDEMGSVAKMSNQNILPLIAQLKNILGSSENAGKITALLERAFSRHEKYGDSALEFVNLLFGDNGLVVLDAGHSGLKKSAIPIFKKEIIERKSQELVLETQQKIKERGFKVQAFPRPINLFYLGKNSRNRIDFEHGKFKVLNTELSFDETGILNELNKSPEKFSPNVILRPIYQEYILPNLAYIGGGGELSYWLERKTQFEYFDIPYPMLLRRDSVLWIDHSNLKKMKQLEIGMNDMWKNEILLEENIVKKSLDEENDLSDEKIRLNNIYEEIVKKVSLTDPTLKSSINAELSKSIKGLDNLEKKIYKAEKRKHETKLNQMKKLKEKLFPEGNLQERKDNFLSYYVQYGEDFFTTLKKHLNPLNKNVKIIFEEKE